LTPATSASKSSDDNDQHHRIHTLHPLSPHTAVASRINEDSIGLIVHEQCQERPRAQDDSRDLRSITIISQSQQQQRLSAGRSHYIDMDRSHEASFEHSGHTFDVHDNESRAKELDESAQTHEITKQRATALARPANNIVPASKIGGEKSSHKHIHDMKFSTGELDRVPSESPPTGCSRGREQATVSQCLRPASTLQPQTFSLRQLPIASFCQHIKYLV
jgi:hypothetical protein